VFTIYIKGLRLPKTISITDQRQGEEWEDDITVCLHDLSPMYLSGRPLLEKRHMNPRINIEGGSHVTP
jgi:hypothetical protein